MLIDAGLVLTNGVLAYHKAFKGPAGNVNQFSFHPLRGANCYQQCPRRTARGSSWHAIHARILNCLLPPFLCLLHFVDKCDRSIAEVQLHEASALGYDLAPNGIRL